MVIKRLAQKLLREKLQENKVLLLYGPRRVGKTTLLKQFIAELQDPGICKSVNAETTIIQDELATPSINALKNFVGDHKIIIIDEAQKIPNIGSQLKLMVDEIPGISVIASGSASFALAPQVGEPLTGRKKTIHLFPISAEEIIQTSDVSDYKEKLNELLVFGGYPELFQISSTDQKKEYLAELTDSYLFRDILELEQIKNPRKLRDLLTLLAFQIGKEVSLNELGRALELNRSTIFRYLDLLEKSFVIINIRGFSRNLRKEVTKTSRYYFYDNGIRNALINNFNPISLRDDVGMLWENYIVLERIKKQSYNNIISRNYFWRTYDQKEIDWVEEREGNIHGYEITWGDKSARQKKEWLAAYPSASLEIINRKNFLHFITCLNPTRHVFL
ncbi:ATP-binding protein [Candidatus Peregrinibacteria bacterium]|nr:ATP-binding protein [Candidatus Peregrinibacteria bacterium]